MKLALTLLSVAALTGCAAHPLYKWGNYDGLLYESYREADKTVQLQVKLERHIAALERSHALVAPGLYAELGTLYMQGGDSAKATLYYTKERDAWPESRVLMDSLIKHATVNGTPQKDAAS